MADATYCQGPSGNQIRIQLSDFTDFKKLCEIVKCKLEMDAKRDIYFKIGKVVYQDLAAIKANPNNTFLINYVIYDIPGSNPWPVVGDLPNLLPDIVLGHKKIFDANETNVIKTILGGNVTIGVNHPDIAEMVVKDGEYFTKNIVGPFQEIKEVGGDGLFTSNTSDSFWLLAHKLLMPAFSPKAINAYTHDIESVSDKLNRCFTQFAKDGSPVDVVHWMTAATFESIAMIGFGFTFNVLDQPEVRTHPFLQAMGYNLSTVLTRLKSPKIIKSLPLQINYKFEANKKLMKEIVTNVIKERKQHPKAAGASRDLLDYMLEARDENGVGLSDENICDQCITFLIAGHDTTANTLSWAVTYLFQHPEIVEECRQEISRSGLGSEPMTPALLARLPSIERVLKETLRLRPPVSNIAKNCLKDCVLPSGHFVPAGSNVSVYTYPLHVNEEIWPNPNEFDPSRWLPENESKRSMFSWLPFSTGARGCIGRMFAMLEAKIILANFLHNFHFVVLDTDSVHRDLQSLTVKPATFYMKLTKRNAASTSPTRQPTATKTTSPVAEFKQLQIKSQGTNLVPVTVLFGSNTGTAMDLAQTLTLTIKSLGFNVTNKPLDYWEPVTTGTYTAPNGPSDIKEIIIICTATYNGQPPENADKFKAWLTKLSGSQSEPLKGLYYGIFGCGNSEWATYQHFPKYIESTFDELGATRLVERAEGNAKTDDVENTFEHWSAYLWETLAVAFTVKPLQALNQKEAVEPATLKIVENGDVEVGKPPFNTKIVRNDELQNVQMSGRSTRFLQFEIPSGQTFLPGDHAEVYPAQDKELVQTVMKLFGFSDKDRNKIIHVESIPSSVPRRSVVSNISGPVSLENLFTYYADLTGPLTRAFLKTLGDVMLADDSCKDKAAELVKLSSFDAADELKIFMAKYRTLLDLHEAYPYFNKMNLAQIISTLNTVGPRRYSIANSNLEPGVVALCVGVSVDSVNNKKYPGVSSNYLARCPAGSPLQVKLKPCPEFRPPADPSVPILIVCAGTGISPFLGFLQDRKFKGIKSSKKGGSSHSTLVFGCRNEHDFILKPLLQGYLEDGTLDELHVAMSRPSTGKGKYVQDLLWENKEKFWDLFSNQKAVMYICGSGSGMAAGVKATLDRVFQHFNAPEKHLETLAAKGQYFEDVWG